jgi:hypothetical protein
MRVTMILADAAQATDGKLYVLGGGWSLTGPGPVAAAVGMIINIPYQEADASHAWRLELIDADGKQVYTPDEQPVLMEGNIDIEPYPGMGITDEVNVPIAVSLPQGHPVKPGGKYEWRLWLNGETNDNWRLGFSVREDPNASASEDDEN